MLLLKQHLFFVPLSTEFPVKIEEYIGDLCYYRLRNIFTRWNMKFLHLGDLHLGKNVYEFSMIEDQRYILNQILMLIKEKKIDGVLLTGDIYDRSVPSEEAVKLLDWFLTELASYKVKVFAISGNHDSDERLHFGSELFKVNDIYIIGKYNGEMERVRVEDSHGPLNIWLMPYVKASRVAHFYPEEDTSTYDKAFRTAIRTCNVDTKERNIILVHQFVTSKGIDPEILGSETATVSVGNIEKIDADCFDDFDYVAMGHIHGCQAVGRETCRYAGSPLKYSLNSREINSMKTVPVITMSEKGNVSVELVFLKPRREVRRIKGNLKDLLENAVDTDDYIYATLTDEETQFDAMARIQEVYPNTMKLDYDNSSTRAIQDFDDITETEGKSFQDLVSDFYKLINGGEPDAEEWKLIEDVAKEAGVI